MSRRQQGVAAASWPVPAAAAAPVAVVAAALNRSPVHRPVQRVQQQRRGWGVERGLNTHLARLETHAIVALLRTCQQAADVSAPCAHRPGVLRWLE
jgi:hypothetical protein